MKEYMLNPDAFLISQRLRQLNGMYEPTKVRDMIEYGTGSSVLRLHIENLMLTYGTLAVMQVSAIVHVKVV